MGFSALTVASVLAPGLGVGSLDLYQLLTSLSGIRIQLSLSPLLHAVSSPAASHGYYHGPCCLGTWWSSLGLSSRPTVLMMNNNMNSQEAECDDTGL